MKQILTLLISVLVFSSTLAANKVAILAGGCFWCMQSDFDKIPGVIKTVVGYDGGTKPKPSYKKVSSGTTNYVEVLKIEYNPKKVTYQQLLNHFWLNIDPTAKDAQFCDRGRQYRSVIFFLNAQQKSEALKSLNAIKHKFTNVFTEILPSTQFYPAEQYHQEYYKKNPVRYRYYRWNCGRDKRLKYLHNLPRFK